MERTFKIKMDYHDHRKIYKHNKITVKNGITVLIGCNGAGKTTMLDAIKYALSNENVPVFLYSNLTNGGSNALGDAFYHNDFALGAGLLTASEGEAIALNIQSQIKNIKNFINKGMTEKELLWASFDDEEPEITTNERWFLFDAIDSGFSIDQVRDLKQFVLHDLYDQTTKKGYDVHIVISANEYELCKDEACFDVVEGKYVDIKSYDDFTNCIMKSREYKDNQWTKYEEKQTKKEANKNNNTTKKEDKWRTRRRKDSNKYRTPSEIYER